MTNYKSGGVNISGSIGSIAGDIVGNDKNANTLSISTLDAAIRPLADAICMLPPEKREQAEAKLEGLKQEAAKGNEAQDDKVADLLDDFVGLVPGAATTAVSVFGAPFLAGIVGPATAFVLRKLRGR